MDNELSKLEQAFEIIRQAKERAEEKYKEYVDIRLPQQLDKYRSDEKKNFLQRKANEIRSHLEKHMLYDIEVDEKILASRVISFLFNPIKPTPFQHLKNVLMDRYFAHKYLDYLNRLIETSFELPKTEQPQPLNTRKEPLTKAWALFYYCLVKSQTINFPQGEEIKKLADKINSESTEKISRDNFDNCYRAVGKGKEKDPLRSEAAIKYCVIFLEQRQQTSAIEWAKKQAWYQTE